MIAIGEGNVKLGIVEAGSEASFLKCLLAHPQLWCRMSLFERTTTLSEQSIPLCTLLLMSIAPFARKSQT